MIKYNYGYIINLEGTLNKKLLSKSGFIYELGKCLNLGSSGSYFYVLAINRL